MLMGAELDRLCGARYRERGDDRVNSRNGYRTRPWDTRVGTIDPQIPKRRHGHIPPGWLLEPRQPAEKALTAVSLTRLLGISTRKVEDLVSTAVVPRFGYVATCLGCRRSAMSSATTPYPSGSSLKPEPRGSPGSLRRKARPRARRP